MNLTHDDSGGRRAARLGDRFTVTLPENPTTGYRWQTAADPDVFHLVEDRYAGSSQATGAGGTRHFTFQLKRAGFAHLRLVKGRSWEDTAVDEFTVDFDVDAH